MGAFVVCWLPFFLLYVIKPFCLNCQIPKSLDRFVLWLGYLNSLLNPIIYICCKPLFRVTFKRILLFKYCRRQGDWKLGKPVQRGILVNCHKHRPNSSSDGPSAGRRKRPGRVMFADCPPGELYNGKDQSLSRTPTLPPERDSDGIVTYRNLPSRDCERQNIGRESYDHQLLNANSNNNCLYMRNNGKGNGGKFLAGASIHHHFRRGDLEQSSSGSTNDVSGSKLCCAGSRSRSSDNLEAMRSGTSQSRSQVVEVEIAREAKDHCSGTEHCPYTNEVFSTRTTETHCDSMNRDEIEHGDLRGVRTDPTGHETLVETQDKSKESVSSGSDLNIFREVLV
ncbi:uncharacterized protein LOC105438005 [Strongylocentrotus purpuratus]|uniref:G-protein coupled receptors family 1 profile domain-containing protein n=1 Tax=Strongylocentrotus purpuratus TaxID=7668 RepID=A0A7M7HL53_STRPU|nr:uncharacterized protein LOC105438005 [Strongylocentrotus purpuratus]